MIDYEEDWLFLLIFRYKGSVSLKASQFAVPAGLIALGLRLLERWFPDFRDEIGILSITSSQLWTATTAILVLVLNIRTNRAISRFWEGTGLLHQMRGEWFDSVSCCVTFSTVAMVQKPDEVLEFRRTIVRLMSLCHAIALAEIAQKESHPVTIDWHGLSDSVLRHLKICKGQYGFNRVEVLLHMTQTLIVNALDREVLKIPPPILSRVFQTLSRGFVNLLNAKKITDTRFPFPYAQLISILLLLHMCMTPIMISNLVENGIWAFVFTFVPIFGMFSLNYVAIELENPFGDDDNDLPLLHFQKEMNNCLLMLLEDHADIIAGTSQARCIRDFRDLKRKLHEELDMEDNCTECDAGGKLSMVDDFEPEPEEGEEDGVERRYSETSGSAHGSSSAPLAPQDHGSGPAPLAPQDHGSGPVALGVAHHESGASACPAQVARRLENLEGMLKRSVEAVERTFEQWMLKAEDHAHALRRNTEAITQLVMVHV